MSMKGAVKNSSFLHAEFLPLLFKERVRAGNSEGEREEEST